MYIYIHIYIYTYIYIHIYIYVYIYIYYTISKYVQILKSQWLNDQLLHRVQLPLAPGGLQRAAGQAPEDLGAHGAAAAGKSEVRRPRSCSMDDTWKMGILIRNRS